MKPIVIAMLAAFAIGAAVAGYLAWRGVFDPARSPLAGPPPPASRPALTDPPPARPASGPTSGPTAAAAVERGAQAQGGIDQRLAAAEQRLARLDLQAQAAAGNAARAEGLLIAFAARRAIDRGVPLGYLADSLRLRFGDAQPNAVATLIEFARRPMTQDMLLARLDVLGTRLASDAEGMAVGRLGSEISSLFVIRRETTPSPQPARRLERARLFLESGRVDKAIDEVERLPGAAAAAGWLADARRYQRAREALDRIETAAVAEPRLLRDGEGQAIVQPGLGEASPAR
ncbi:MAG: hypothetical protein ACEQR8_03530 [Cypionkella sp.]